VRVKLDENLGSLGASFLRAAGVDVTTVAEQGLCAAADASVIAVCATEDRCLVTLDKDFSDPVRYPPRQYAGIVVVRLPGAVSFQLLERALAMVVEAAKRTDVRGRLWIAEVDCLREYEERLD
jgi:predicted nuclease of predicted toxin-antitoxin system